MSTQVRFPVSICSAGTIPYLATSRSGASMDLRAAVPGWLETSTGRAILKTCNTL